MFSIGDKVIDKECGIIVTIEGVENDRGNIKYLCSKGEAVGYCNEEDLVKIEGEI